MTTCVGGVCGVPTALRTKESTITIRVNAVTRVRMAGNSVTAVRSNASWSGVLTVTGSLAPTGTRSAERFTV